MKEKQQGERGRGSWKGTGRDGEKEGRNKGEIRNGRKCTRESEVGKRKGAE